MECIFLMIKEWKFDWKTFLMKRKIAIYEWGDFGGQDTYMPMLNISCNNFLKYIQHVKRGDLNNEICENFFLSSSSFATNSNGTVYFCHKGTSITWDKISQ